MSDQTRTKSHLLTTTIAIDRGNIKHAEKHAASLFVTINQNQARVKSELIFLTAFDAMGSDTNEAVAGKVLKECNDRANGPLTGLLRVRPLIQRSRGKIGLIPIVTIVHELAKLLDKARVDSPEYVHLIELLDSTAKRMRKKDERVRVGVQLMAKYFGLVKDVFKTDYASSDSNLMCAKYLAALVVLLRSMIVTERKDWISIKSQLVSLRGERSEGQLGLLHSRMGLLQFRQKKRALRRLSSTFGIA